MKILIVAATEMEISLFRKALTETPPATHQVEILITGVGMLQTTYALTQTLLGNMFDCVLQAGVAGSFDRSIALGTLVSVVSERYGDLGAQDHEKFIDIFDMGLIDGNALPYTQGRLEMPSDHPSLVSGLKPVHGLTVNSVSGNATTIQQRTQLYKCDVESMEGAAFFYVCLKEGVRFAQVRAISNYVEPRNRANWNMKDAIVNLNRWLVSLVSQAENQPEDL